MLFPDDEELWSFFLRIFDFEPRLRLRRVCMPLLALFGRDDPIVPVPESVRAYRDSVRSELLTVAVFPGVGHRLQNGDPPAFATGYLETLSGFVRRCA